MKNKVLVFFVLLFHFAGGTFAQSKYELFGGVSISNSNRYDNNHQAVNFNPNGSPDYALRPHFGVLRTLLQYTDVNFQLGLGLAGRGSKNSNYVIWPVDTIQDVTMYYLQMPLLLNYRLLKTKNYYLVLGLTPSLLIWRKSNISDDLLPKPFGNAVNYMQLEYKLGVRFPIIKNIDGMMSFNRSIFPIAKQRQFNVPTWKAASYHHTFDLTLIYKL